MIVLNWVCPARGANKINRLGHVSGQCARAITNPDNITDNNLAKHRQLGRLARWERHFRATPTLGNGAALAKSKIVLPRHPPKRMITKQQAVRHLIHASSRMLAAAEDPFAIHLLIQSADKLLIDLSKKTGRKLVFTWDEFIKPEYKDALIEGVTETANFFKHADAKTNFLHTTKNRKHDCSGISEWLVG